MAEQVRKRDHPPDKSDGAQKTLREREQEVCRLDAPCDDDGMENIDRKGTFAHRPERVRDTGRREQVSGDKQADDRAGSRETESRDRGVEELDVPVPLELCSGKKCPEREPGRQ